MDLELTICIFFSAPSGAPMNFNADLDNTVVKFTWDPVAEDKQNGDIAFYTLQCSIGSEQQFAINLTYTVEEISVGVYETSSTYTCKFSASTLAGEGPTATDTVITGGRYLISLSFLSLTIAFHYYRCRRRRISALHSYW